MHLIPPSSNIHLHEYWISNPGPGYLDFGFDIYFLARFAGYQ